MKKIEVKYLAVKDLKLNPDNPRVNNKAIEYVINSIKEFGFKNPLMIDDKNIVWCGNTRLKAARKLKLKEVPTVLINDLTEEQKKAFALADNKTGEIADWDEEMLNIQIEDLSECFDMSEFGSSR